MVGARYSGGVRLAKVRRQQCEGIAATYSPCHSSEAGHKCAAGPACRSVKFEIDVLKLAVAEKGNPNKMTKAPKEMILGALEAQHGNEFYFGECSGTRNLGYGAAFRRMCQSRHDEAFVCAKIIAPARGISSRSIRSSPRRASRERWSSSILGALLLHKSPLSMLPPSRGYIRGRLGVTSYVI
jgi:hypothetical protein